MYNSAADILRINPQGASAAGFCSAPSSGCCSTYLAGGGKCLEVFTFVAVECNEDEQHDGEGPH